MPLLLLLVSSSLAQANPLADADIDLFVRKCASCHSVGQGARVGPDLKNVHQRRDKTWLTRMIAAPSELLDTDATARGLLQEFRSVRMPDLGLSAEAVEKLLRLLEHCSREPCELAGKLIPVQKATPQDIARGENLFWGLEHF